MADSGLRGLGEIIAGKRAAEPSGLDLPAPERAEGSDLVAPPQPIFAASLADGPDALGLGSHLGPLAEMVLHKGTETPLAIGLLGPAGSGKSFALTKLLGLIEDLAARARPLADSPFAGQIITLRADASALDGEPATALAGALYGCLAKKMPSLAAEAARAARDPRAEAAAALERLHSGRRKLEAERRILDETNGERIGLAETLRTQSGTELDTFARGNQAALTRLFHSLSVAGDAVAAFKEMAARFAPEERPGQRIRLWLRALFGFPGQRRLARRAVLLLLLAAALGYVIDAQALWLGWLRGNPSLAALAGWLAAHIDWLPALRFLMFLGAGAFAAAAAFRAFRLVKHVSTGASLFAVELAQRGREMDHALAHQAKHVEALAGQVEILGKLAAESGRRAGDASPLALVHTEPAPFPAFTVSQQAQAFAAAATVAGSDGTRAKASSEDAPERIVIAIDGLEKVAPFRARAIVGVARTLFGQGYVTLLAICPTAEGAGGVNPAFLSSCIDVPLQLAETARRADPAAFVWNMLNGRAAPEAALPDARTSCLDKPLTTAEARLLVSLAPLAGRMPGALKRFINLYRLARAQEHEHLGALAFMLACSCGATPSELGALREALQVSERALELALESCGPRLNDAFGLAQLMFGKVSLAAAQQAYSAARIYAFDGG